mmetsp:Transcript_25662/g.31486  ORF Transcript_25662/g.31486 Transcript_25662/m.31486 type:complete len:97 (-) Transcript_25662:460-750(-)
MTVSKGGGTIVMGLHDRLGGFSRTLDEDEYKIPGTICWTGWPRTSNRDCAHCHVLRGWFGTQAKYRTHQGFGKTGKGFVDDKTFKKMMNQSKGNPL